MPWAVVPKTPEVSWLGRNPFRRFQTVNQTREGMLGGSGGPFSGSPLAVLALSRLEKWVRLE